MSFRHPSVMVRPLVGKTLACHRAAPSSRLACSCRVVFPTEQLDGCRDLGDFALRGSESDTREQRFAASLHQRISSG